MATGRAFAAQRRVAARPCVEELEPRLVLSLPVPDHVVIAIEENHGYSQIIGSSQAPFINALAAEGALFTQSYAIEHPSQPNYLDLFSGSNQGIHDDSCPHTFSTANLGGELEAAGLPFGGYSEDLPYVGYTGCTSGSYARKHNPWVDFTDVPTADNMPFAGYFPSDYSTLPVVSFVVPNQLNDMHDGAISQGDTWLRNNLRPYLKWAFQNNSLFMLTFDEDNNLEGNRIVTIFAGPMVVPGQYSEHVNHFNVLRTLEDMYGVPPAGGSGSYNPITDVWVTPDAPGSLAPLAQGAPVPGPGLLRLDPGNAQALAAGRSGQEGKDLGLLRGLAAPSPDRAISAPTTVQMSPGLINGAASQAFPGDPLALDAWALPGMETT